MRLFERQLIYQEKCCSPCEDDTSLLSESVDVFRNYDDCGYLLILLLRVYICIIKLLQLLYISTRMIDTINTIIICPYGAYPIIVPVVSFALT
jgi:hypothetical protein